MLRKTVLACAAALAPLAAPGLAAADVLASDPLFLEGASGLSFISCYVSNAGTAAVALTARFVGPNGQPIQPVSTSFSCGATLPAGQVCGIVGLVAVGFPYACVVTTAVVGAGAFLRGTFQHNGVGDDPGVTTPLLPTGASGLGGPPPCEDRRSRGREQGCKPPNR